MSLQPAENAGGSQQKRSEKGVQQTLSRYSDLEFPVWLQRVIGRSNGGGTNEKKEGRGAGRKERLFGKYSYSIGSRIAQ